MIPTLCYFGGILVLVLLLLWFTPDDTTDEDDGEWYWLSHPYDRRDDE